MNNNPNLTAIEFSSIDLASNRTVYARISPCSWMYEDYGTQVGFSLTSQACNAETIFVHNKTVLYAAANDGYIIDLLRDFIHSNGVDRLDKQCEEYRVRHAKLLEEVTKQEQAQAELISKQDAENKAKGFTHRIEAWVHSNGDDHQVGIYMVTPSVADIKKVLRDQGCHAQNDYKIIPL